MDIRCSVVTICLILLTRQYVEPSRILISMIQQKSHTIANIPLAQELIKRGHDVYTVLGTAFGTSMKKAVEKNGGKIIWFQQNATRLHGGNIDDLLADLLGQGYRLNDPNVMLTKVPFTLFDDDCHDMFQDSAFMQQIRSINFDFAVTEYVFVNPCTALLAVNLSVPYAINVLHYDPMTRRVPGLPSFTYSIFAGSGDRPTFLQKLHVMLGFLLPYFSPYLMANISQLHEYAPAYKRWLDIAHNAELMFSENDFLLNWPAATMPHVVQVPGTTFRDAEPLPEDIKVIADSSESVIVMTFGSMGGKLPASMINKFIQAFSSLTDTVFMSYSGNLDALYKPTQNVHIRKWLPQNDLLGHPKTRMFITHGGHFGQSESVYHGVPVITFPLYAEQMYNAYRAEAHGFGVTLDIHDFTPQELLDAINYLKQNTSFSENVKKMAAILKDAPKHPVQVLADSIEHVMKYGGKHLRSSTLDMPLYEFLMLDILAFLYVIVSLLLVILWCCFKTLVKRICTSRVRDRLDKVKIN